MGFRDRPAPDEAPLFMFWHQHRVNAHWVAFPENLPRFLRIHSVVQAVTRRVQHIGAAVKSLFKPPSHGHHGQHPQQSTSAFSIPADFDDSALNWSLGSALYQQRDSYPQAWSIWTSHNFDFSLLAKVHDGGSYSSTDGMSFPHAPRRKGLLSRAFALSRSRAQTLSQTVVA